MTAAAHQPSATEQRRSFVARLWAVFDELAARGVVSLSDNSREIAIAQAALESGWGASRPAKHALNLWNLTCGKAWLDAKRPFFTGGDLEYSKDGKQKKKIVQSFRAYATLLEAVEGYVNFLRRSTRYRAAWTYLLNGNLPLFVLRLRDDDPDTDEVEGGFFTAPLAEYRTSVISALAAVRRFRLDHQTFLPAVEAERRALTTTGAAA